MKRRPIATRYAALVVALLSAALFASGTVETWFSHRERQAALEALQREKAQAAANEVSRFVDDVLRSLDWVTLSAAPAGDELERRRLDFLKLLRLEPAITTATLVDASGRERLRVSRIKPDRLASGVDLSGEPGFSSARRGGAHFGDVYFVAETEPYLTIGAPSAAREGSVVLAEVNLKFVWNVVSGIRIGTTGYAYVVDAQGRLVSHPDISRVLQMTDLSRLPQVQAARASGANQNGFAGAGRDPAGVPVLSAYAKIAPLNWTVFVEQPRAEAFAPLFASIRRSALILIAALVLAVTAGIVAARRMVAPIGELRRGAQRFGAGDLAHRIEVASGDELQELATQFNAMGEQLRETYESLERRVAERTRDLNERNVEITEALEQQTATAEILRVISSSPTDAGPVFETIVSNTTRLCEANFGAVFLFEQERLYTPAHTKVATPAFADYIEQGFPVNRGTTAGRATLERKPVQIIDILADPEFVVTPAHRGEGIRTVLSIPMLRKGEVIGAINAWRHEVRPFSDKQMNLLETFARQAVIAIDNVRLFKELEARNRELAEALEQQTATAEVLRVISSSPTEARPVFETIVRNAARLCNANFAFVMLNQEGWLSLAARTDCTAEFAAFLERGFPANRGTTSGRAAMERRPVQVLDFLSDTDVVVTQEHRAEHIRTVLAVPMLREDRVRGVIAIWRREVRPFSEKQIKLLETFADQAVIAVENLRLFKELETRNRELAEALEQQTATAEVLRVISSSPTEARPVFETIVRNAARLCNANFAFVMLNQGGPMALAARTSCTPEFAEFLTQGKPPTRASATGRAALEQKPVQILDFLADPEVLVTPAHRIEGIRTVLAVPMLRNDRLLGVIAIWRREVRAFSEEQVKLLETFADQAVIAVENLRLFNEIQETSRQLDLANQAKSRFLAAASHDLRQPMHALSLFVGQLRASRTPAERGALVQRIEDAVGSLSDLLDQLLDLSKLEAGAVQAVHEEFAIRDTLAAIETQFAPLARAKGIELRMRASRASIRSDPLLVQRVLLNLVANAIRYTDQGGVLVGCRRRGERLRIAVWDTGCGIPDDRRDDVFREFVQLGGPERRHSSGLERALGRGLGLGLAIVARLADLLGTRIELYSRLDRGSMFAFELPLGTASAARPRPPVAPLRVASLRGVFALVVDDDEAARAGTCGLLESWGCLTLAAADGVEAIAQLRAHDRPPDLIVCDYQLTDRENGLEAISRIRVAVGEDVPAIIITADTAAEVASAAQAAGIPLLHKPVSPVKLRALLAQVFARASGGHRAAA
jgi:signal transduction histidine kinase/CheY-like chemotaxis protein